MRISVLTPTIRGIEALGRPAIGLMQQTFKDFEWLYEIHNPKEAPDFNACMNRLLRRAKGDIIVFLQDYILPNNFSLEMFVRFLEKEPDTFFTAPVGKTKDDKMIVWDWRKAKETSETLNFQEWEIDFAAARKEVLFQIGGFDEELDKYWGFDNVNLALRAEMAGIKFRNIPENTAVAWDHNAFIEHPYMQLRSPDFHNMRLTQIIQGEVEVKYL